MSYSTRKLTLNKKKYLQRKKTINIEKKQHHNSMHSTGFHMFRREEINYLI